MHHVVCSILLVSFLLSAGCVKMPRVRADVLCQNVDCAGEQKLSGTVISQQPNLQDSESLNSIAASSLHVIHAHTHCGLAELVLPD